MMSIRAVCLVLAVVVVTVKPPLMGLWLLLWALGMTILPWVAVVLANDRLPTKRHRWRPHRAPATADRGLSRPADQRIIELEPDRRHGWPAGGTGDGSVTVPADPDRAAASGDRRERGPLARPGALRRGAPPAGRRLPATPPAARR